MILTSFVLGSDDSVNTKKRKRAGSQASVILKTDNRQLNSDETLLTEEEINSPQYWYSLKDETFQKLQSHPVITRRLGFYEAPSKWTLLNEMRKQKQSDEIYIKSLEAWIRKQTFESVNSQKAPAPVTAQTYFNMLQEMESLRLQLWDAKNQINLYETGQTQRQEDFNKMAGLGNQRGLENNQLKQLLLQNQQQMKEIQETSQKIQNEKERLIIENKEYDQNVQTFMDLNQQLIDENANLSAGLNQIKDEKSQLELTLSNQNTQLKELDQLNAFLQEKNDQLYAMLGDQKGSEACGNDDPPLKSERSSSDIITIDDDELGSERGLNTLLAFLDVKIKKEKDSQ